MYVTGSSKNIQYKKPDHSFYRGIVIDDQDPNKLMRVKVFIPELSNQPYEGWLDDYNNGIQTLIQPGAIGPLLKENVETLKELIPWAEQMAPLMGESGTSHYFASEGEQRSKATYVETATQSTPPNSETGGTMPRIMLTNPGPRGPGPVCAFAAGSTQGYGKTNPHGNAFAPKNSGPESSGVYGTPQVGSHVWVFHYRGDLNYPVYFGTSSSYRDTALVFGKGESYPASYESNTGNSPESPTDTSGIPPILGGHAQPPAGYSNFRATAYGLASIDPDTAADQKRADLAAARNFSQPGDRGYRGFSQTKGASGRTLVPGYSVASNHFPQGTLLRINGREYRVDDTGSQTYLKNDGIDFFAGDNRQQYDAFARMRIESIEVIQ